MVSPTLTRLSRDSLKILSEIRQTAVLNAFLEALTRGGPGGLPRPIELHAHDPTRYVGDMLAWVHQVMAGEREFLESLFSMSGDMRMVGSIRQSRDTEEEEYIRQLMDTDLEKLCMPLRVSDFALAKTHLQLLMLCGPTGTSLADCQISGRQYYII